MTTPVGPPNYQQLRRILSGKETTRGTKAAMATKLYGRLDLQRRQPLADSEEFAGTFFADYTAVRGAVMVDGTYYQQMTYEDGPLLAALAIQGGVAGTSDSESTPGYVYPFRHSASRDDIDTRSIQYGDPVMIYECEGMFFPEFTISSDIDDAQAVWKWNSRAIALRKEMKAALEDVAATGGTTTTFVKTGWAQTIDALIGRWVHFKTGTADNIGFWREILDNDATSITFAALPSSVASSDTIDVYPGFTAGVTDRTRETIKGPGTKLYLDAAGAIGTTQQTGRFISFSVTGMLNAAYKRFMDNVDEMSNRVDRGMVRVSGQVRMELDRRREWDKYIDLSPEVIRIEQTGSTIDSGASTKKRATIDIYNARWDDPVFDTRGNNNTATWPFRGYVDATETVPLELEFKNALSAIPS